MFATVPFLHSFFQCCCLKVGTNSWCYLLPAGLSIPLVVRRHVHPSLLELRLHTTATECWYGRQLQVDRALSTAHTIVTSSTTTAGMSEIRGEVSQPSLRLCDDYQVAAKCRVHRGAHYQQHVAHVVKQVFCTCIEQVWL